MLTRVLLGEAPSGDGLVDLLMACHQRIRRHSRLAFTIGARVEADPREAVEQCLRYFLEALPLHVRDEEDSLEPRLAGKRKTLDVALAQMRAQHCEHESKVAALLDGLRAVQQAPGDHAARKRLSLVASSLETDLEAHLRLEESTIFPLINELLPLADQHQLVRELRARRGA